MNTGDGRFIDERIGALGGEGSGQKIGEERLDQLAREAWTHVPSSPAPDAHIANETYYDRPVLKEPVWKWYIPAYFYAGGASGAAATIGALARVVGGEEMRGLTTRSRWIATAGGAAGTFLLIVDLGKPERFLNMLRVFRPTSPMNLGSWVVAGEVPLASASALLGTAQDGVLRTLGDAAGIGAGLLGLPMASYTGVLVAGSAIPVWQAMRNSLPALFAASAVSSATSLLEMMSLTERELSAVSRLGTTAKIAELASMLAAEREGSHVDRVGKSLREGFSGALWKASKAATAASLLLGLLPGKWRWKRIATGALGTAGAMGVKFAVWRAGFASARDPRATFDHQRAGYGGRVSSKGERAVPSTS